MKQYKVSYKINMSQISHRPDYQTNYIFYRENSKNEAIAKFESDFAKFETTIISVEKVGVQ